MASETSYNIKIFISKRTYVLSKAFCSHSVYLCLSAITTSKWDLLEHQEEEEENPEESVDGEDLDGQ